MSHMFFKTYKRETIFGILCVSFGYVLAVLTDRAVFGARPKALEEVRPAESSDVKPFVDGEKFYVRKTANIQSPISAVELWEVASSKSLCIVAVNINHDQTVQSKLYVAQVAMNCMQPK